MLECNLMTVITCSHGRRLPLIGRRFFVFFFNNDNSQDAPFLQPPRRYYFSEGTNTHDSDATTDDENNTVEAKPTRKKTKRAKSMARLIISKPWSSELEASLSSLAPSLSKTTVLQTLYLVKTPAKALSLFNWVQEKGFVHNDQSYFQMLEILGRSRTLNIARNFLFSIERRSNGNVKLEDRFFNSLIRSYGRAGLFQEALKLFSVMKSVGVSPSVITFNGVLTVLLRRGRVNMAQDVFDEMLKTYGVTPDTYTFNILIRGFCRNSMVDDGFRFFNEMSKFNCVPDVVTYNTLVDGLCRAGKVRIAHNVVKGMVKKSKDLSPDVVTYTTLVRGYCMKQEIDDALMVFQEMVDKGLKPNDITHNTLIQGLCEVQRIDKVKEIFKGMLGGVGFTPDTCTFNTLLNAHCNVGNLDEAWEVFEKMVALNVQPDSATYSILIRNLCQRGDYGRAEQLFDELLENKILLRDDGCKPLVAAYNPMFEFLCKSGKTNKADRLFRQLMKRGTQDPPSYMTLIMGHCREGTVESGYALLVFMLRRGYSPDFETYMSLIYGLLKKDEALLAYQTLEKMLKSSHFPKTSTFHSVLEGLLKKGCAPESARCVVLMLETKVRQNVNLSTHAVRLLFSCRLQDRAFEVIGLLYDNGYMVDMEELVGFLCQCRKLREAHKLLLFCLEKHEKVNVDFCNVVIEGLCRRGKLSEAFELYYELVENGNYQQLRCLENLKIALESGGKLEEANFVSKRMPNPTESNRSPEISSRRPKLQPS